MKVIPDRYSLIFFILIMFTTAVKSQNGSLLTIKVGDNQGSNTYEMVFGNHINATWGMKAEKDSLGEWNGQIIVEKESPPLPPGLGVVWRPSRSGVNWGIGFMKYDIKGWKDSAQVDTFRLYFVNTQAPETDITLSWSDSATLSRYCTAMILKIGSDSYDMFKRTSVKIPEAGNMGINQAYIYKTSVKMNRVKSGKKVIPH